jgi:hypothetical protein
MRLHTIIRQIIHRRDAEDAEITLRKGMLRKRKGSIVQYDAALFTY